MFPIDKGKTPGGPGVPGVVREKNYQSTTWSLNPQAYQNVSNDMVDWAALAQQWIQMKETCPADDMPAAPPPPPLTRSDFEEQGEAPMEVVKEEESSFSAHSAQGGSQWSAGWSSYRPQNQWRESRPGWTNWPTPGIVAPPAPALIRTAAGLDFRSPPPSIAQLPSAPTWPRARFPAAIIPPAPSLSKPDSHVSTSTSKSDVNFVQADTTTTIDAAKRKNLPAWIREGLEKMEREKQRQAEREREEQQRREEIEKRRQVEEQALKELENMKKDDDEDGVKMPEKSKFESDSDSEADEVFSDVNIRLRKSNDSRRKSPETKAEIVKKTVEELMLDVRKTLTEILLEVTNEEIIEIANETIARAQRKKPKPILAQSSILTTSNLPSKLGLSIYGTSDSEGESEAEEEENTQASGKNDDSDERNSEDSDQELQERIKRQVNAFKKTSREIEQQLAEEEEREERKRLENEEREQRRKLSASNDVTSKNNGSVERNRDGETEQLDRNSSRSGRSSRPKKQSRFSDPRDTVRGTHLTHVSILGAYKMDPMAPGLPRSRTVSEAGAALSLVTPSSSKSGSSRSSGRSRRRSVSTSDEDDEVSSTSSSNSRRRHRRSRSSDRHSRHSSHSSRRTRSRSRERRSSSSRHSRH